MLPSMTDLASKIATIPTAVLVRETVKDDSISSVHLCDYQGIPSVMRVDKPLAGYLDLDRAGEFDLLYCIQPHGFSPEPLYSDPGEGILICRFLEGDALTPTDLGTRGKIVELGKILGSIHRLHLPDFKTRFVSQIRHYEKELKNDADGSLLKRGIDLFDSLTANEDDWVVCHNDLIAANLVQGERLLILDWEYASLNHPYFDLATVLENHALTESQSELFLDAYSGERQSIDLVKLDEWRQLTHYVTLFWLMIIKKYATISEKEKAWMVNLENRLSQARG